MDWFLPPGKLAVHGHLKSELRDYARFPSYYALKYTDYDVRTHSPEVRTTIALTIVTHPSPFVPILSMSFIYFLNFLPFPAQSHIIVPHLLHKFTSISIYPIVSPNFTDQSYPLYAIQLLAYLYVHFISPFQVTTSTNPIHSFLLPIIWPDFLFFPSTPSYLFLQCSFHHAVLSFLWELLRDDAWFVETS